ncbi:hypothetical protein IP78_07050 [Brevundimonas sp. AAP58]|nr:hypothetical protein IP78_07050 [Brevundimonas sp. AAP58]
MAVIGIALTAIMPPRWVLERFIRRRLRKRSEPLPPSLTHGGTWRPSLSGIAALAGGLCLLMLVLAAWRLGPAIGSGSDVNVQVELDRIARHQIVVIAGLFSFAVTAVVLLVFKPQSPRAYVVTALAPSTVIVIATSIVSRAWRFRIELSPELIVKLCLTCGEPQPPPRPPEPVVVSVSIDGGTVAAECPRDPRTRIGPFETGKDTLANGQTALQTQVGRALQALRDRDQDRILRSFVIIGSADESRFERRQDQSCTGNMDLARCRAEKVAAALPAALGDGAVGAPPVMLLNASGGLVRWTEGPRESVSGREVRLCALWETGSPRPAPARG